MNEFFNAMLHYCYCDRSTHIKLGILYLISLPVPHPILATQDSRDEDTGNIIANGVNHCCRSGKSQREFSGCE